MSVQIRSSGVVSPKPKFAGQKIGPSGGAGGSSLLGPLAGAAGLAGLGAVGYNTLKAGKEAIGDSPTVEDISDSNDSVLDIFGESMTPVFKSFRERYLV